MPETQTRFAALRLPALYAGLPLLLWALGGHPQRTLLKTSLSLATLAAFGLMLGLFQLSRINHRSLESFGARRLFRWHRVLGYSAAAVLLIHPFLLVVPRFFEAGVAPLEAFFTIITSFGSRGVLFGLVAWTLSLLLGLTALLRRRLPLGYRTWRLAHGVMAALAAFAAACHVIDLGRHSSAGMITLVVLLTAGGLFLLLRSYTAPAAVKGDQS